MSALNPDSTMSPGGNEPVRPLTLKEAIAVAREKAAKPNEEWWSVTAEVLTLLADAAERAAPAANEPAPDSPVSGHLRAEVIEECARQAEEVTRGICSGDYVMGGPALIGRQIAQGIRALHGTERRGNES